MVHYVTKSKDGVIRRVCVKYFNHKENKPRFTDRAVRSLVKLLSINDSYFMEDMAKVKKLMADLKSKEMPKKVEPTKIRGAVERKCRSSENRAFPAPLVRCSIAPVLLSLCNICAQETLSNEL